MATGAVWPGNLQLWSEPWEPGWPRQWPQNWEEKTATPSQYPGNRPLCATLLAFYPELAPCCHRGSQSSKSVLDRKPAQS